MENRGRHRLCTPSGNLLGVAIVAKYQRRGQRQCRSFDAQRARSQANDMPAGCNARGNFWGRKTAFRSDGQDELAGWVLAEQAVEQRADSLACCAPG